MTTFLANPDLDAARAICFGSMTPSSPASWTCSPARQFLLKRPHASKVLELTVDPRACWI